MSVKDYTGAQIERMDGAEIGAILDRLPPRALRNMLIRLSGYDQQVFEYLLRSPNAFNESWVCDLQADDENWCILPAGHTESHSAGEFTWDTPAELDELHTIAVT